MKILGYVLSIWGGLSLLGGFVNPSGALTEVVVMGYVFKFAMLFGGVALISIANRKKQNAEEFEE